MTSRNWVKLFLTTLMIGGLTTAIVGYIVRWNEFLPYFTGFKMMDILSVTILLIGMGFLFSLVSQMGFFAYLTIHRFGLGIFKSVSLWNGVQILLILFSLFDLIFFSKAKDMIQHVTLAAILVIIGLLAAKIKVKQTTNHAFIPALFFIIVATMIEWVPALRIGGANSNLMFFGLLSCNIYQLLTLHKFIAQSEMEREKKKMAKGNKENKTS